MAANESKLDRLYALVANEEDARAYTDISDDACQVVSGNFFLVLCSLVLTKIGDQLASPKIVLSWLLGSVGTPPFLIAWLVPMAGGTKRTDYVAVSNTVIGVLLLVTGG